jgi:hypothetical protein
VVEHVAVVDQGGGAGGGHQPGLVQRRPGDQRRGVGAGRARRSPSCAAGPPP